MALSSSQHRTSRPSPSSSLRAHPRPLQHRLAPFQRRRARSPPPSHRAAAAAANGGGGGGGGGGSGGGSSGGGGGPGDNDDANSSNNRSKALIAGVLAAAATATAVASLSAPRNDGKQQTAAAAPPTPTPTPTTPTLSIATSDDVSALKRLLREAFEAQLNARKRLDALERAAADAEARAHDPPEAGDEVVPGARALNFTPGARERAMQGVRVTGGAGYRGILVWANGAAGEGGGGDGSRPAVAAANTLRALGACADAGVSLYVHHHSPAASVAKDDEGKEQEQGGEDDNSNGQATALDATPLGGGGMGAAAATTRRPTNKKQQNQPWHSRDRRITVRLASGPRACDDEDGGAPLLLTSADAYADADDPLSSSPSALSVRQVLVRLRPTDWLPFLVAPLGGSLASLARPPAPLVAAASAARGPQPAATRALRRGHDLSALRSGGVGKAVAFTRGAASLTVGHFAASVASGGEEEGELLRATTAAQLALHPRDGESAVALSLARVAVGPQNDDDEGSADKPSSSSLSRHAFLGASAPGFPNLSRAMLMPWLPVAAAKGAGGGGGGRSEDGASSGPAPAPASYVLGASWSAPVGDALAATAWAEKGSGGGGGWGVSLRTRADEEEDGGAGATGPELGVVLARASTALACGGGGGASGARSQKGPLYCEVSARLSGGQGACVTPGVIVTLGGEAPLVAYTIAGAWRF